MKSIHTMWRNVRRSPYQAFAAIFIMLLTFLVVSFFSFIVYGSSKIISYFEAQPQVTAFFKDDAKQDDINALRDNLSQNNKIAKLKYVSKQEALQIYKQQNKNDPLLLDLVTADVLPASLEVSTHKIEDLAPVSQTLKTAPIVQEVIFQKDVVSTLSSWTNALRRIGVVLVVLLSVMSMFIMIIIIGIKISQKREDIDTMRLIGATSWYVRWPFIFEGIFYGIIGAIIGWLLSTVTLWLATPALSSFLRGIPIFPVSPVLLLELLGIELLFAVCLGAFSSFIAVLRYLK
ncbi:MAG TPA: permease-like cell division protein FtsX [Candidatus Saccharimonadales bacterium]|nr:permease-like cell division protein FtsX [Candidatus Saccharimonadales bacterium]